jgi:hypothetical protein
MNKYNNSKIYKLVCNNTGLIYYGSTIQPLHQRKCGHKKDYKKFLNKKCNYITSFKIIEGGNYDIILVEEISCENREQLEAKERFYIDNNICVNKNIPARTIEEKRLLYLLQKKEHYDNNKEEMIERSKKYYEANKEKISLRKKELYEKLKK